MHPALRLAYDREMAAAVHCYGTGDDAQAFRHLELAHVLGQQYVAPHVRTHFWMLKIGLRRRSPSQIWGQLVRIVLGALGSAVGRVPTGNTGGTNISMFARLPIDPAIHELIKKCGPDVDSTPANLG